LANALASHFEVTVLQAVDPAEAPAPPASSSFKNVLSAKRGPSYTPANILRGLIGPLPITVLNYLSKNVESALTATLDSVPYDAIQIENIHMVPYLRTIRRHLPHPRPVVLDWHNIESELIRQYGRTSTNPAKKLVAARIGSLLCQVEKNALAEFSAHTVVSEPDRQKLLQRNPRAQIKVIPNGVDSVAFAASSTALEPGRRTLLFVGSMDYHANAEAAIWFCRQVWPQLANEFPNLDFKIVGRNPPPSVQALASQKITVTGTVNDVRPFYHQAFAVLVPLRVGGGTRLKILEAMAAGVPVISTRLGAEGISAENQIHILLADTADEMAAATRRLLNQPDLVRRLRQAALELVRTHYDWSVLGQQLANLYQSLTA
jgi:glycosyltransferase involved in cell wall biosynthesis